MSSSIGSKMARGAIWMVLAKLAERSLGLISTLILARVLVPHDFGIVAMAMSFVALLEMVTAFGFDVALIQRQTQDRAYWDTAWTFDVFLGLTIALLMIVFAGPVATFFREPQLVDVLRALALGSALYGFQNIGVVTFRSDMRFDREFRFLMAKKLVGFCVTIPLALQLDSYWALVIGQVTSRAAGTALSYWVHPYRPRLSLSAAGSLFHFSRWLMLLNCVNYLKERSSDWVIGRLTGPASLAAFNISYELASLPSTELSAPINRAVFPGYAKLATQGRDALAQEYLSVIGMIVLLAAPAVMGLAATADLLIPVLVGPNWAQATTILPLLAFFGFTNIVQGNAQAAYLALGRADLPTKINGTQVVVQLAALIPLTAVYGVVGAALAYLLTACVMIPLSLGIVLRMLSIRISRFIAKVWRPVASCGIMYLVVQEFVALTASNDTILGMVIRLLSAVLIGAITYVSVVFTLWLICGKPEGAERIAVAKVSNVASTLLARWRISPSS